MNNDDVRNLQYYLGADRSYYEPMQYYAYERSDFHEAAVARLDSSWEVVRSGIWLNGMPKGSELPLQGWKIHLSAVRDDAAKVLEAALGVLVPARVPFKFLLDRAVLGMTTSKSWSRGGAGKFMTVYPADEAQFRTLLEALSAATAGCRGPYILSDRRYRDSKVVFYRYGGIRPNTVLDAAGRRNPVLVTPDGALVADVRTPYFELPEWVEDIAPEEPEEGEGLNGGRYAVESSLAFSNSGGVYLAKDSATGRRVVVKEARPMVNESAPGRDVVSLLEKEHGILSRLADRGVAPRPVEFFREWEHAFLVEEYLDGYLPLGQWASRNSITLRTRFSPADAKEFMSRFVVVFRNLAAALKVLHGEGVLFGDFSANNVMLHPDTLEVRLIDFEGAQDAGSTAPASFFTPSFSDPSRRAEDGLRAADDYYAFGANMFFVLARVNQLAPLRPGVARDWLACFVEHFGLPGELEGVVLSLMDPEPSARPRPWEALGALSRAVEAMPGETAPRGQGAGASAAAVSGLLGSLTEHLLSVPDLSRRDRLWPAASEVFETNPVGVGYGACGVLKVLNSIAPGRVRPELVDWVLERDLSAAALPPGLRSGMAGAAWTLLELGRGEDAGALLDDCSRHSLLAASAGLYEGLAGWGLANLRFWTGTGEARRLEAAVQAGRTLLARGRRDAAGLSWPEADGEVRVGLGHGAAGVAVFLAALAQASGSSEFADAAGEALRFDLAQGVETPDGGLSWPASVGASAVLYPYLASGSAGIGRACLRLGRLFGDGRYEEVLERIFIDCDRLYTTFPGHDEGLAGIGEFLLDGFAFTGQEKYRAAARRVAEGLLRFAVPTPHGTAFPGSGLFRISCDFATGGAGVASFLHRLERGGAAEFMLDAVPAGRES